MASSFPPEPITSTQGLRPDLSKPPISVAAARIIQVALGPNVSIPELATLAAGDPGFAARVLSIVNSAAYGLARKVIDVKQACSLLGVRGLRNAALALVVGEMVPTGEDGTALLTTSLRRAVCAKLVAEALSDKAPEDAFTAGLFLEIALLSRARSDLAGAAQVARMPAAHRPVIERAFGLEDHAGMGARIAATMHLPLPVVEAIARHHDPEPVPERIAKIGWAAERLAGAWEGGDLARVRQEARRAVLLVGVKEGEVDALLRRVPELVTAAADLFHQKIDQQIDLDQLAVDAHARLVEMNNGYEALVRRLETLVAEKELLAQELRRANADLAELAATDGLTGLPNKRSFSDALARDLARADRAGTCLGLVVMDVDHFKKFNDTWGHQTGDVVLTKVAQVLRSSIRNGDVPARYGGEEFVALLPNTDGEGAVVVAERIRRKLEEASVAGPKGPLRVTASFGVAVVQGPGCRDAGERLIGRADAALYDAKRAGRNRVLLAKPDPEPKA